MPAANVIGDAVDHGGKSWAGVPACYAYAVRCSLWPRLRFEFGQGVVLRSSEDDVAMIVSSGRGVHEALSAAVECAQRGVNVGVVGHAVDR